MTAILNKPGNNQQQEQTDADLLGLFVLGDRQAFDGLVERHLNWVYAAAKQQVRDAHLAEDVTQTVFLLLARKARSLTGKKHLGPWLFRVMRYTSLQALRTQRRRKQHESKAAGMANHVDQSSANDEHVLSEKLNDLIARLKDRERQVLLLRFYEGKSFSTVGTMLGISEEAARKRVERAVHRLRERLGQQGTNIASALFVGQLVKLASVPSPMSVKQVAANALSVGPSPYAVLVDAVGRALLLAKIRAISIGLTGVILTSVALWGVLIKLDSSSRNMQSVAQPQASITAQPKQWLVQHLRDSADQNILPGWPLALPGSITGSPAVAQLNGRPAIIVPCEAIHGQSIANPKPADSILLYAFYADGTIVPGWPAELVTPQTRSAADATNGRYVQSWCSSPSVCADANGNTRIVITTPYFLGMRVIDAAGHVRTYHGGSQWVNVPLADLDGDGVPDIITGTALLKLDGGSITNWPSRHPLARTSGFSPCIGDPNHDGKLRVYHLFVDNNARADDQAELVGYDAAGHELPGWRHRIRLPRTVGFAPVMGDVSGDDRMEIIAGCDDLHVWTADGADAPGTHDVDSLTGILKENVWLGWSSPTLADLDGDGKAEIIVYDEATHSLRAWHGDGRPLIPGDGTIATIPTNDPTTHIGDDWRNRIPGGGVSVANLSGDGIVDLFVGTFWVKWSPRTGSATVTSMLPDATVLNCVQPTICDIDGDHTADIILGLIDGRTYIYRTNLACRPELLQWPTASGNFQRTGVWRRPTSPPSGVRSPL